MSSTTLPFTGLTDDEVRQSRESGGTNVLDTRETGGLWTSLKDLLTEPMLLLLLVAASIYFVTGSTGEGVFMLGAIVLISAISLYQDQKTRNALQALKSLTQARAKVIRNGEVTEVPREDLVLGDYLVMEEGTRIAADALLLQTNDFSVNESILTGESLAVYKSEQDADPQVYQGTLVTSGRAVGRVESIGAGTRLSHIGLSLEAIEEAPSPLQLQIRQFVRSMALVGGSVFVLVWALNLYQSGRWLDSLLKALTLAMSILPEEIPVAFTTFMALGAWRLMKMGIIVRRTQTVETLGSATVICTDKTGTITENRMALAALYTLSDNAQSTPDAALNEAGRELLSLAMWSSEPEPFDPMELSLHEAYARLVPTDQRPYFQLVHEYPLGGQPPMMTHVFRSEAGQRIVAAKGAPEAVMAVSNLTEAERQRILDALQRLTAEGYRVLGVVESPFTGDNFPETQQQLPFRFKGLVAFYDPPKSNIGLVFEAFYEAGIQVKIITGDNAATTQHIARQTGFRGAETLLHGDDLLQMDEKTLTEQVGKTQLFARMFPEAKLRVINALKARGEVVAMTGDGVNDGPALKAAHIGIAMGRKGTEIAKQAAALVLVDDDLARMVDAIAMGRKIYISLKNAIRYIISIHIPIILTVLLPLALGWVYPTLFTPVHVIFFELIMGPTCSIIYENEPLPPTILRQPPRPLTARFFSFRELSVSIVQGLAITAGLLALYQYAVANGYGEALTRSLVFISLLSANVFLTLINRSFHDSVLTTLRYRNPLVPFIILTTIGLTTFIFLLPPVAAFFALTTPTLTQTALALATGALSTLWFEIPKALRRRGKGVLI